MTESSDTFLYEPLDELLSSSGAVMGAAEFHGLLVGALCAGAESAQWQQLASDSLDVPGELPDSLAIMTGELYNLFKQQLAARDYKFQLLLPSLEVELVLSTRALGEWVTGLLAGLGAIGGQKLALSEECQELLEDMVAITQISHDTEGSEEDLIEVVEYVRVAVFTLYEEIVTGRNPPADAPLIH
ncbi:UPF0149 family protein [Halioxenophilus sp. WMMB6]|uniref:UPF0149 family protein n=1 Tax=Halioxenophilus sp. WMMB6 TaxID=3073815 RepID=UPI00295ED1DD|nr:UPF0149 family protein [Halioxenophilus sp. WMMB6]